jgi:hypothetical protein
MTLRGLVAELAGQGVKVSYRTVWNFVHRAKVSYKKSVFPAEQNRPSVAAIARAGNASRTRLIKSVWFSSTKPGSRPIWRRSEAGAREGQAPRRARSAPPLVDINLCGRAAPRRDRSARRL